MKDLLQAMNELLSELDKAEHQKTYQRLFPLIYKIQQLQQHNVMGWRPDHKTIRAAAATYADDMCKLFENDTETKRYCKNDFIAGAEWALSQAACR